MVNAFLILFISLFSGCASMNPFTQFYQDQTGGADITTIPTVILPAGEPQVFTGSNIDADSQKMLEDNYELLGWSSFNTGEVSNYQLIAQAKKVKAEVVIFYSEYTNTVSGAMPLTLPDTQTTTTNLSGGSYNSGSLYGYGGYGTFSGSGSFYGSATSTTYGTKTTYIPYSQNRYDYVATFWIKMKSPLLGIRLVELTPELRQSIGSNKGALVSAVIKNSPAFSADILKGDILKKINEIEINNQQSLFESLMGFQGQTVNLEILRGTQTITKQVIIKKIEDTTSIPMVSKEN